MRGALASGGKGHKHVEGAARAKAQRLRGSRSGQASRVSRGKGSGSGGARGPGSIHCNTALPPGCLQGAVMGPCKLRREGTLGPPDSRVHRGTGGGWGCVCGGGGTRGPRPGAAETAGAAHSLGLFTCLESLVNPARLEERSTPFFSSTTPGPLARSPDPADQGPPQSCPSSLPRPRSQFAPWRPRRGLTGSAAGTRTIPGPGPRGPAPILLRSPGPVPRRPVPSPARSAPPAAPAQRSGRAPRAL